MVALVLTVVAGVLAAIAHLLPDEGSRGCPRSRSPGADRARHRGTTDLENRLGVRPGRARGVGGVAERDDRDAARALAAYGLAELDLIGLDLTCHLSWVTVAGLARIESDHGRFAGSSIGPER